MAQETWKDVGEGLKGAVGMAWVFLTPMFRGDRSHWGIPETEAHLDFPGDERVPSPKWGWTHAVYIDAPASAIWPWLVQIGQHKGGFYSYEFLEHVAGYDTHNAQGIRPEWQDLQVGDVMLMHDRLPEVRVVEVVPNEFFVVHARADLDLHRPLEAWEPLPGRFVNLTWGFFLRPQVGGATQLVSRFRVDYSPDFGAEAEFGPTVMEPISYMMDRKLLEGVKERVEKGPK